MNQVCMYYYNFFIIITIELFTRRVYKGNTLPTADSKIISFFLWLDAQTSFHSKSLSSQEHSGSYLMVSSVEYSSMYHIQWLLSSGVLAPQLAVAVNSQHLKFSSHCSPQWHDILFFTAEGRGKKSSQLGSMAWQGTVWLAILAHPFSTPAVSSQC